MYIKGLKPYDHLNRSWKNFDIIKQAFVIEILQKLQIAKYFNLTKTHKWKL